MLTRLLLVQYENDDSLFAPEQRPEHDHLIINEDADNVWPPWPWPPWGGDDDGDRRDPKDPKKEVPILADQVVKFEKRIANASLDL